MNKYIPDPRVMGKHPPFSTPDGAQHATWNKARRHLTYSDLLDTILRADGSVTGGQAKKIADALERDWRLSKKAAA